MRGSTVMPVPAATMWRMVSSDPPSNVRVNSLSPDMQLGQALMTFVGDTEARIQSNHDCVKGQEQQPGLVSLLQGVSID